MKESHQIATHADDGDLVRFLDQQVSPDQRRWLFAHLAECEACAGRMEALREQSQVVANMVGSLDTPVPDELTRARALAAARRAQASRVSTRRWYASGSVRAAAVVSLAALATLGVGPVRAWVADLFDGETAAPPMATAPIEIQRGSVVSFEPAGEIFILEVEHAQKEGSVHLELRDAAVASAEVVNGASEEILALPAGLRVTNSSTSRASYSLLLPANLKLIQVFAGGVPVAIIPLDDVRLPWSRTVTLDPADLNR